MIVIGSGIAGLCAALAGSERARVALVTKGALDDGCSRYAQGGIAVAIGSDDDAQSHFDDTIAAGRGLCDEHAVRTLVEEGASRIRELIEWGVCFDTQDGELQLGREAAHSHARIVHARGDGTGLEIESALIRRIRASAVTVLERSLVRRLLVDGDGRCCGVELIDTERKGARRIATSAVILATGGAARLWRNSTNPASATGDGIAVAFESGAEVSGMEFMQFHPTALAIEGAPRFLISEAVRGEGAHLVNAQGRRFLFDGDEGGELAARDVVARAIWQELHASGESRVYLDCRPIGPRVALRFPGIQRTCLEHGVDMTSDLIPVAPAAHYTIGGVQTNIDGASSVPGLYACGEVASSGVHGANRLASNSLLESVVFAHRAAGAALRDIGERRPALNGDMVSPMTDDDLDTRPMWRLLGDTLWNGAGVLREASGLQQASAVCDEIRHRALTSGSLNAARLAAAATTASLVCAAGLAREESRGCHLRLDFPQSSDQWRGALVMHQERGIHIDNHV